MAFETVKKLSGRRPGEGPPPLLLVSVGTLGCFEEAGGSMGLFAPLVTVVAQVRQGVVGAGGHFTKQANFRLKSRELEG